MSHSTRIENGNRSGDDAARHGSSPKSNQSQHDAKEADTYKGYAAVTLNIEGPDDRVAVRRRQVLARNGAIGNPKLGGVDSAITGCVVCAAATHAETAATNLLASHVHRFTAALELGIGAMIGAPQARSRWQRAPAALDSSDESLRAAAGESRGSARRGARLLSVRLLCRAVRGGRYICLYDYS